MGDDVGEEFRKFIEGFHAGAPVPAVDPEQWKRFWRGLKQIIASWLSRNGATEVGAIAVAGGMHGSPTTSEYLAMSTRADLIRALFDRGVLRDLRRMENFRKVCSR